MFSSFRDKIKSRFQQLRGLRSGVSKRHDFLLVKRARQRKFPSWQQFFCINKVLGRGERIIFFLALAVFVISLIWGARVLTQGYRVEVPAVAGSYTEGVIGSPQFINPLFSNVNDVDQDLVRLIYSGLMRYDSERRLVPDLASQYEISEDGKTYTFHLRQDVVWHDGEKFTSADVVFTFEMIQDQDVGSPLAVSFQDISLETPDDFTVIFHLPEAFPAFLSSLTVGIIPGHIWNLIPPDQLRLAQRNLQPVGSGPFRFVRLVKDDSGFIHKVELERFEDYYREPAYLKDFAFVFFSEYEGPGGVITALREQEVDGINFVPYELREKVRRKHIELKTLRLPQYTALFFNQQSDFLQELDVRLAFIHALDKERIVREVLENEGEVIAGPILEGFPGYQVDISSREFSVDMANELLDKVWPQLSATDYRAALKEEKLVAIAPVAEETNSEDESGEATSTSSTVDMVAVEADIERELDTQLDEAQLFYRLAGDSDDKTNVVQIKLVTVATPTYTKVAELIAGYWQDVGVKVNVQLVDAKDLTREVLRTRDYDILLYGVILGADPDQYAFWHSSQTSYPGLNLSLYVNRQVDEILETIRESKDEAELDKLYVEFQDDILQDAPAAFLYTPIYTYVLSDKIQGFASGSISTPADRFANVTQWFTKTKGQWNF